MRKIVHPILTIGLVGLITLMYGCGDANIRKAKRFQENKDYAKAIEYYHLALEKDPDNQSVRYSLVELYTQQLLDMPQEYVTPELVEQTMLELTPVAAPLMTDPNVKRYVSLVYQLMAKRYAEAGKDDKAAESWTRVTEIEPSFAEAQYNLGVALSKLGRHEDSLVHFGKAIDLNPYFVNGYYAMGNSYLHLNRNKEAIEQYQTALELNPDDPGVHHNLGAAYSAAGDVAKAIESYQKALELDPNYMMAYQNLVSAYTRAGETEKAAEAQKKLDEYAKTLSEAATEKDDQQAAPAPAE